MSITGPISGEPCKAGVAIIDLLTGVHAFSAIIAALLNKEKNGTGQKIECNLLATQIAALANIGSNYLNAGVMGTPWGTAHESIVPYQAFKTKDSRFYVIGAGDDSAFKKLCHIMDLTELAENPDYETNVKRVQNREKLLEILSNRFSMYNLSDWTLKFSGSQLPSGPINNVAEAFEHEQVKHLGLVQQLTHPKYGNVKTIGNIVKYSTIKNEANTAPPLLGEHTVEILQSELGISNNQIEKLIEDGVIGVS